MNPKKLGKIDNHRQEPWKAPLPIFIETLLQAVRKERRTSAVHRGDRQQAGGEEGGQASRAESKP